VSDDLGDIPDNEVLRHLFPGSPEGEQVEDSRPYSMLVEPRDFQDRGRYKYVIFDDGKVLFCDATDYSASHQQIVEGRSDHKAISAGKIAVKGGKWAIVEGGSMSAKLHRGNEDEDHILKVMCPMFTYDIEVSYW